MDRPSICEPKRLYMKRARMIDRCHNPNNADYMKYGGRGITVCKEWRDSWPAFRDWAFEAGYDNDDPHTSIDRIDPNKGYCPENCRWISMYDQQSNKRCNHRLTYMGRTQTIMQWSRETGIPQSTLLNRLSRGWPVKRCLGKDKKPTLRVKKP